MILTTKRLILRPITMKDAKGLVEQINNIKISRYLLVVPHPYTLKDARWFINDCKRESKEKPRTSYEFTIELKEERKLIGGFGLTHIDMFHGTADLGYWLGEGYRRKGYATEAAEKVMELAFKKLRLRKLRIPVFAENKASNGFANKLGFKLEGTLRKHCKSKSNGKIHDENIYGLLREEWKK